MILSNRNGLKNTRNMLRVFGRLNETYSCTEAEYSAGINFSARNFPALSTRLPRRKLREEADLNEDPGLPGQAGFRHCQPEGERSGCGVVGQKHQRGVCTLRRGGQGLRGEWLRPC